MQQDYFIPNCIANLYQIQNGAYSEIQNGCQNMILGMKWGIVTSQLCQNTKDPNNGHKTALEVKIVEFRPTISLLTC